MKKITIVAKRIFMFVIVLVGLSLITKTFGDNSVVTKFYKDKVLNTPYNFVGVIMLVCAACGKWIGKKNGGKLLAIFTFLFNASSIVSFGANFVNFFSEQKNIEVENKADYGFEWVNIIAGIILTILVICISCLVVRLFKSIRNRQLLNEDNHEKIDAQKEEAKRNFHIYLQKEKEILEQIKKEQERKILIAIKDKLEYKIGNRICPKCGAQLKNRQNGQDGKWFIGCDNYFSNIECRFTCDYHEFKIYEELYCVRDDILLERYYSGQTKIELGN